MKTLACRHNPPLYVAGLEWDQQPRPRCLLCFRTATGQPVPPPAPKPRLPELSPCVSLGLATGESDTCAGCLGKQNELPTSHCAIHSECNPDPNRTANRVENCLDCHEYRPKGIVIEHGGNGLGDAILGLGVVASLGRSVLYNCGPTGIAACELFDVPGVTVGLHVKGHSEDTGVGYARQMNRGYDSEQRLKIDRCERYAANIGAPGFTIPRLKDRDRVRDLGKDFAGAVVLCPWSVDPRRQWPLERWLILEEFLINAGHKTVILHNAVGESGQFKGAKVIGQPIDRVAGILLNAATVVGIDSGLAHLAGMLCVPSIVIGLTTDARSILGCYPLARTMQNPTVPAVLAEVESLTRPIPDTQSLTPEGMGIEATRTDDRLVFEEVVTRDDYNLRSLRLPTNPLIVDVGAHVGCFAAVARRIWPTAEIHCAECCPENLPILDRNVYGFAKAWPKAVTYEIGPIGLLNTNQPGGPSTCGSEVLPLNSLEAHQHNPNHYWRDYRPLEKIALESIAQGRVIDLLKLDCEGSEYSILENCDLSRVRFIVGEWHDKAKWMKLLESRFLGWGFRILRDDTNGTFWLKNPRCNNASS